jgi:hypothetical protein
MTPSSKPSWYRQPKLLLVAGEAVEGRLRRLRERQVTPRSLRSRACVRGDVVIRSSVP